MIKGLHATKKIGVRSARFEDLTDIIRIESQSFPSPWSASMYSMEMLREQSVFLVAEEEGRIIGHLCAWEVVGEAHVLKLAVEPESRYIGVGKALMEVLTDQCMLHGVDEIWLEVREGNDLGRGFYRAIGFHEVGARRGYYSDTGEDAVLMLKELY